MNRGELRAAVLDALNRKDLSTVANTWIASATTRINTMLRHRQQMKKVLLPVGTGTFDLPTDFIEAASVVIPGVGPLTYSPPADLTAMAANTLQSGDRVAPQWFTVHGLTMEMAPWRPRVTYSVEIWYFAKLALPADDAATNFFLTDYPHVYLNACMASGHRFMLEQDAAMGYEQLFAAEVMSINDAEENARIGRGPLIMRPQGRRIGGRHS